MDMLYLLSVQGCCIESSVNEGICACVCVCVCVCVYVFVCLFVFIPSLQDEALQDS